jgi:hypothetical protein
MTPAQLADDLEGLMISCGQPDALTLHARQVRDITATLRASDRKLRKLAAEYADLKIYGRLPMPETQRPVAPNVDGQDFYELCQTYRHSKEIAPHPSLRNTVQAFNDLREYIKTGWLPWPSYESAPVQKATKS